MRRRRGRRGQHHGGGGDSRKSQNGGDAGGRDGILRIRPVAYLAGCPGNRHTSSGEPIFMFTVADRDGSIETIAIDVADTQKLVIDSLIALREAHHPFAAYLIDRYFKQQDGPFPHHDWDET